MTLEELRKHLNDTDRQIMDLIAERQSTINKIAAVKHSTGAPLRDYKRESEVFANVRARATELGVSPKTAEQVMRILIRESLTTQEHRSVVANRGGGGQRALIIGGTGKMGGWFAQFLESQGFGIEIADPRASSGESEPPRDRGCRAPRSRPGRAAHNQ